MKIMDRYHGLFLVVCLCVTTHINAQVFHSEIPVSEASGIACVDKNTFLVVDDELGVFRLNDRLETSLLLSSKSDDRLDDLEGITVSDDGKTLYLLSEKAGRIFKSDISFKAGSIEISLPTVVGSLPEIGKKSNKGWEGIAYKKIEDQEYLVAVHQKDPVVIGVFRLPELEKTALCLLPAELEELLKNLGGIALSPRSGNLFLLSGKSRRIVEIKTDISHGMKELTIVSKTNIFGKLAGNPEGICFDNNGNIIVVTDGSGRSGDLLRFSE